MLLIALVALGCSGDIKSGPTIDPASLELIAGDLQSAEVGSKVPVLPSVRVLDQNGSPLADIDVHLEVVAGGGAVAPAVVHTNVDGVATATSWTLGHVAGANILRATAEGLENLPVELHAIGMPGPAAAVAVVTAPPAVVQNNLPFTPQPVLTISDEFGNPVSDAGVPVTVKVTGPTGGVIQGSTTATSDAAGKVSFTDLRLAGPAGQYILEFDSDLLAPFSITVQLAAGVATGLVITTQPSDSAFSGVTLVRQPAIQVVDESDNPVHQSGIIVTASVAAGGGSLAGGISISTDLTGIAHFTNLSLVGAAGTRTISFTSSGLTTATSKPVVVTFAPPAAITIEAGDGQTAPTGTAVPLNPAVLVTNAFGSPVAGVSVSFAPAAGSGSVAVPSATTNAQGIASSGAWTLGAVGQNHLVATAPGLAGSPITFTATSVAGVPATLTRILGDNQTGVAGSVLPESLVVRVADASGNGIAGQSVSWATSFGSVSPSSSVTDANGRAATRWTLGVSAGAETVIATAPGVPGSPVIFSGTAIPGPATTLTIISGDNQTGTAGVTLAESLVVRVTDGNGNGIAGRNVAWSAGSGSVAPAGSLTDANGFATTSWTLGPSTGAQTATVNSGGISGSPATFTATAVAGIPGTISIVVGDGQSGTAGTAVAESLVVKVADANGNGVAGRTVNWTTSSGALSPSSSITDANGLAATRWTLGPVAGAQSASATSPGLAGGSVVFGATATTGAPASLARFTGDLQSGTAGAALPESLVVRVADANGNGVAGKTVTWTASAGSVSPLTSVTDVNGVAATRWTLGTVAGSQSVSVAPASAPGISVSFTATAQPGAPASMILLAGVGQSAPVGTALPESLVVKVVDQHGNSVPGRAVTWATTGGSLAPANSITDASGATASLWTLGPTPGGQTATATTAGIAAPATFSATAQPSAPSTLAIISGNNQIAVVGTVLPESLIVRVTDGGGNGVPGRTVNFTAASGTVSVATAITDANGFAATRWRLGTTAGAQTATATSLGLSGSPAVFAATGTPGAPSTVTVISGNNQSGDALAVLPESLVVKVTDANGNAIAGRSVSWTTLSGTLSPPSSITDAGGLAATQWTLGLGLGNQTATATVAAIQAVFTGTINLPSGLMHPVFSTYLGGNQEDQVRDITVDRLGNIYVVGGTASDNFRTTAGAYDQTQNGNYDAYVAKLSPTGQLLWSTFVGGPNYDRAYAVEVDDLGNVYIAGRAGAGFPVTSGSFQPNFNSSPDVLPYGPQDGFVCKLSPNGSAVRFCSYFGTDDANIVRDIDLTSTGDIILASARTSGSYPASWFGTGFRSQPIGGDDGVVARVSNDGSQVKWLTFLGGTGNEAGEPSLRVDPFDNILALYSSESDNAPTPNGFDHTLGGIRDFYLVKLPSNGSQLLYATYLGGSAGEDVETHELAVNALGQAIVSNGTQSPDFPTTSGVFQPNHGGQNDGFVTIVAADGSHIVASTFLGGPGGEKTEGVSVDAAGNIYVTGSTSAFTLPFLTGGYQGTGHGLDDMIFVKLSPDLKIVLYGSYLGGNEQDLGRAGIATAGGDYIFGGNIFSGDWPTVSAMQPLYGGGLEGAVAKFSPGP